MIGIDLVERSYSKTTTRPPEMILASGRIRSSPAVRWTAANPRRL